MSPFLCTQHHLGGNVAGKHVIYILNMFAIRLEPWQPHVQPDVFAIGNLVGAWVTPLKNMSSSIGMISNPIFLGK